MSRLLGVMGIVTCLTIAGVMFHARDRLPSQSAPGVQRLARGILSGGATVAACGAILIGLGTGIVRRW